jgi:hypothetical protein
VGSGSTCASRRTSGRCAAQVQASPWSITFLSLHHGGFFFGFSAPIEGIFQVPGKLQQIPSKDGICISIGFPFQNFSNCPFAWGLLLISPFSTLPQMDRTNQPMPTPATSAANRLDIIATASAHCGAEGSLLIFWFR